MKSSLVILSLFYTVSSVQLQPVEETSNFNTIPSKKHKRQDDRWIWGYAESSTELSSTENTVTKIVHRAAHPCVNKIYSPKPDFSALGKKISETKCYEYIWELKHRYDESEKEKCKAIMLGPQLSSPFVLGGWSTKPAEFPHMGAIGWKASVGTWIFKCGSSLISPKFVLTAAHCSKASPRDTTIADTEPKLVRLGGKNIIDKFSNGAMFPLKDVNIIRVIVHPKYASPHKYFDVALMELEEVVEFTRFIQPACLWSQFDTSSLGSKATLTGWGVVETGGRTTTPELQAAELDVIDQQQCDQLLKTSCNRNWCGLQDHQLCAGVLAGGVDACQGDSGGPLQTEISLPITSQGSMHYIIGVTSFGIDCALPNLPGVYTRVSSFIDWIEDNVWR